jgi:hypothetical protein
MDNLFHNEGTEQILSPPPLAASPLSTNVTTNAMLSGTSTVVDSAHSGHSDGGHNNEGTGQISPPQSPILLPPHSLNGMFDEMLFETSMTVDGAHPDQFDGSTIGTNTILDQSYQSQPYNGGYSDGASPSPHDNLNNHHSKLQKLLHTLCGPNNSTGSDHDNIKPEKRCCGCRRRTCLIITFFICILIAVVLFFVWPRIPEVTLSSIRSTEPMLPYTVRNDDGHGFQGKWEVDLALDSDNFVLWSFKTTTVTVYVVSQTAGDTQIGTGTVTDLQPSRGHSIATIPVNISYLASGPSDIVLINMTSSCTYGTPVWLRIRVEMTMSGLTFVKGSEELSGSHTCKTIN